MVSEHQKLYPDQYIHELVGKLVYIPAEYKEPEVRFRVGRVIKTRYGLIAIPDHDPTLHYAVHKCIPVS